MNYPSTQRLLLFILLAVCIFPNSYAQRDVKISKQDSLLNILRETDSLELKSEIHFKLYDINRGYNPRLALKYLKDELALQEITNNRAKLALANSQIGWCYIAEVEEPEQAKVYLDKSYEIAVEIKDSVRAGVALTFLGFMHQRTSQYRTAMDYYFKSLKYKMGVNQPNRTGFTYNLIGETYNLQEQYEKSLEFHFKALAERKKVVNGHIAHSYQNIGGVYANLGDFEKSYDYYQKALEIRLKEKNIKHLAMCYNGLGKAELGKSNIQQAIPFFEKSIKLAASLQASYIQTIGLLGLAKSHLAAANYESANTYVEQALVLATKHGYRDHEKGSYEILSQFYSQKNDPKNALLFYQKYVILKDSIINKQTSSQVAELEGIYNTEKKEQEIVSLTQANTLREQKQQYKNWIIYTILSCCLLLFGFLIYTIRKRKTMFRQRLAIKDQENEITRLQLTSEEDKSDHYAKELKQFMKLMITKNLQIKELQQEIEEIPSKNEAQKETLERISQLYASRILTEDDWKTFRSIFEQVHPNFIEKLITHHKKLTQGELKLASLLKLNLSTSEISSILGISAESARKNKYRFKKKLDFNTEEDLLDFILNL